MVISISPSVEPADRAPWDWPLASTQVELYALVKRSALPVAVICALLPTYAVRVASEIASAPAPVPPTRDPEDENASAFAA